MAYLQQNLEDLKDKGSSEVLGNNQPQTGGQSSIIEGSQPGAQLQPQQSAPRSVPTSTPAPKKASSGQFTNLKSYLNANQGASQKLGQTLTTGLQKESQQVGNVVQQQKDAQAQQIQQLAQQRAQAQLKATDVVNQAAELETGQGLTSQQLSTVQDLTTGNQKFEIDPLQQFNAAQQQVKADELEQRAQGLGSFSGRFGELSRRFGQGARQYAPGQANLDSFLLGSKNADQLKQQGQQISSNLNQNIAQTDALAKQEYSGLLSQNELAKKSVNDRIASLLGLQETELQSQVAEAQKARQEQYNAYLANRKTLTNEKTELAQNLDDATRRSFANTAYSNLFNPKATGGRYFGLDQMIKNEVKNMLIKKDPSLAKPTGTGRNKNYDPSANAVNAYINKNLKDPRKLQQFMTDRNIGIATGGISGSGDDSIIKESFRDAFEKRLTPEQQKALNIRTDNNWLKDFDLKKYLPKRNGPVVGINQYASAIQKFAEDKLNQSESTVDKNLRLSRIDEDSLASMGGITGDLNVETAGRSREKTRYKALADLISKANNERLVNTTNDPVNTSAQTQALQQAQAEVQKNLDLLRTTKQGNSVRIRT
jgi:hypothetical protein